MPLHLSEWQYRLMPPFLVSILPLSLFWSGYGMEGELSIPGLISMVLFVTVAILIAGSAQVVDPEEKKKPATVIIPIVDAGTALVPDSPWLAGWLTAAVGMGLIILGNTEARVPLSLKGLVFGGHVLWTSLVFWWFYRHARTKKRTKNGMSRHSFHRRHY